MKVSTPGDPPAWLGRPLTAFFESVGVLVGDELTVHLTGREGWDALAPCAGDAFWVETQLLAADGRVVLLIGEGLVRSLGAKLLMLPEPPDDVTDEIELAFDEIINVAIGAWNREVQEERRRWNNGVDARSMRRVSVAEATAAEPAGSLRAVGFTLAVDGAHHAIALVGTGAWLPETAVCDARAGGSAADSTAAPAAGEQQAAQPEGPGASVTPIRSGPSTHGPPSGASGSVRPLTGARPRPLTGSAAVIPAFAPEPGPMASADIAVVDVTGVFLQWFYEQLRNPDFVFSHCPENYLDTGEYRAVLLVHPRALRDAGLTFDKQIIMRRS